MATTVENIVNTLKASGVRRVCGLLDDLCKGFADLHHLAG
jgi:hypothetical protein